jgi:hypothetical protein
VGHATSLEIDELDLMAAADRAEGSCSELVVPLFGTSQRGCT